MALLTDQILASGISSSDLIHIVITGDTSQNPAGSSYKATIEQLATALGTPGFSGGTVPYNTYFSNNLSANTFSATTYLNFPGSSSGTCLSDLYVGSIHSCSPLYINPLDEGKVYFGSYNLLVVDLLNGDIDINGNTIIQSGLTANTLNIASTPVTDTSLSANYLTRDGSTGEVKVKTIPGPTVYGLFAQTGNSAVVSATTVESTLIDGGIGTLSVPANGFSVGDSFRADFGGLLSAKNNDTLRIRVKAGSIVLADSLPQTMTTSIDDVWQFSVNFTIRQTGSTNVASIVSLGVFHTTKQSNGQQTGFAFNTVNSTTFDTTISNTLNVTAEWSSNSTLNSIYSDIFVLNKIF